ncbi:sugar ABC transporter substrate-binding protein [Streptomyces alfalfae]|uniref:Sugar ABC transporter substrate-binding protein n=2 Tax=Streptomyces alfalfae TaxID=1642299 RepID=A0ABM6GST6_9ACTN|nr:extracellular solute-binding protein [Streptomyces alfalfae]AYA16667.1 extracellular solute-binding protein [Streptomyces fradiae]APY86285.1 sugar ABC transporter substrate-binding protein [Streptomyces alfalfae]QUI33956.1 extracellular solute-binding protein [Streptomyces alfalfae]RXX44365.1 sugar ABC transporter substrate-binding protein [Streptomyces alfalfae]RZM86967.1 extracellular solute-binding protein [Streptomyces alfalfae]
MRPTHRPLLLAAATLLTAGALSACGGGSGDDPDTVKISYKQSTDNEIRVMDTYLADIKKQFEKANPGKKVKLVPIKAPDAEYYTKLQQMLRSPKTAPDLVYEDTFLINSDITSGYLKPLDPYLAKWKDWDQFIDTAKTAAKAADGKTYGVPDGTDTRGLWFSRSIFEKAGLPADWQPKNWDEILDAARTIKKKVPGVTPLNVYTGKPVGEAASMQGFEMLAYGTGEDPLYDPEAKKWVTGSKGFKDSLAFVETVFKEKLGPDVSDALDPNFPTRVRGELLPEDKLGINLDGSWLPQDWGEGAGHEWPEWSKKLGLAHMPTQAGQAPGKVSMSGGWTWAIPSKADNPDLAFTFIETMQTKANAKKWYVANSGIAVREDVAADPSYVKAQPGIEFFTDLVASTHYRPAYPAYPKVSTAIQEAMESVTTGDASVADAARGYDEEVESATDGEVIEK